MEPKMDNNEANGIGATAPQGIPLEAGAALSGAVPETAAGTPAPGVEAPAPTVTTEAQPQAVQTQAPEGQSQVAQPQAEVPQVQPQAQPQVAQVAEVAPMKPKKDRTGLIVILIIAVLVIGAVAGLLIWKPWDGEEAEQQPEASEGAMKPEEKPQNEVVELDEEDIERLGLMKFIQEATNNYYNEAAASPYVFYQDQTVLNGNLGTSSASQEGQGDQEGSQDGQGEQGGEGGQGTEAKEEHYLHQFIRAEEKNGILNLYVRAAQRGGDEATMTICSALLDDYCNEGNASFLVNLSSVEAEKETKSALLKMDQFKWTFRKNLDGKFDLYSIEEDVTDDMQRRRDLAKVMEKVTEYQTNNNGRLPSTTTCVETDNFSADKCAFLRSYLNNNGKKNNFKDPDGTIYGLEIVDGDPAKTYDMLRSEHLIRMVRGVKCGDKRGGVVAGGERDYALIYTLEESGIYCLDSDRQVFQK